MVYFLLVMFTTEVIEVGQSVGKYWAGSRELVWLVPLGSMYGVGVINQSTFSIQKPGSDRTNI